MTQDADLTRNNFANEIIAAENNRIDLLKWKLILVAALGAVGLGVRNFNTDSKPLLSLHLALCLIPFVCVYVDILCLHLQMRILIIGRYCRDKSNKPACMPSYEQYCHSIRDAFKLEDGAQQYSTYVLSGLVVVAAFVLKHLGREVVEYLLLAVSGVFGIAFTFGINRRYTLKAVARRLIERRRPSRRGRRC